jgi:hypothetical protein
MFHCIKTVQPIHPPPPLGAFSIMRSLKYLLYLENHLKVSRLYTPLGDVWFTYM